MFGKGKKNREEIEMVQEEVPQECQTEEQKVPFGKKLKQYLKIAAVCVVLAVAVVIVLMIVFRKEGQPQVYLYVDTNNCLYVADFNKPADVKLLTGSYQENAENGIIAKLSEEVLFSQDGKKLYYPANKAEDGSYDVYRKEYKKEESEPVLMAKDVLYYQVAADGRIVYIGSNRDLYVADEKERKLVSVSVIGFAMDEKGKSIIWIEEEEKENGLWQCYYSDLKLKKDAEKLQGRMENWMIADFDNIFFEKDDNLYYLKDKKEKIKICSDVTGLYHGNENNQCYYLMEEGGNTELYFFDGKESTLLEDELLQVLDSNEDYLFYAVKDKSIKLYLAKAGVVTRVDLDDVMTQTNYFGSGVDKIGEIIYFLDFKDETGGTVYAISYKEGSVGNVTEVDEGVESLEVVEEGRLYYIKDSGYSNSTYQGDMYCEGELIAEDMTIGRTIPCGEGVYYMTDWSNSEREGTLMWYQDGKEKKVADNVYYYRPVSEKLVFIRSEYDGETFTLSYYNGKKVKEIAKDVAAAYVNIME